MHPRLVEPRARSLAGRFPALLILGARQVGKTTLARQAFSDLRYVDLEDPQTAALWIESPRYHLDAHASPGVILDEVQSLPDIFPVLRGAIDADRKAMGRFILLGSAQPTLVRQVSETLAGRVAIVELAPLTASEASGGPDPRDWRSLWLSGGFPDALSADRRGGIFREWWEFYLRTFVERDLPALGVGADPLLLRRLLTMLAHAQGGLANIQRLAASLGVAHGTVTRYLDILERTFLLRRLLPYHRNIGKRLVKSPKLYLRDTGLVHHLLNIGSHDDLEGHPIRGASWETFVIEDVIRREMIERPHAQFYFWRTAAGAELDLILDRGDEIHAIEVKTARAAMPGLARRVRDAAGDVGAAAVTIVDQADGEEPLAPQVSRRGFGSTVEWLPDNRR